MDKNKQKALESAGWRFGTAGEFLGQPTVKDLDLTKYQDLWATYIPSRNGADFKIHTNKRLALSALNYGRSGRDGKLFHFVAGVWEQSEFDCKKEK